MRSGVLRALDAALALGAAHCAPLPSDGAVEDGSALRQTEDQDVDAVLASNVPVRAPAGDDLAPVLRAVRSWTLRYVEYRDPSAPTRPDLVEPFKGFFMVALDASGAPLFVEATSFANEGVGSATKVDDVVGVVHTYLAVTTSTDASGKAAYDELTMGTADTETNAIATSTWLAREREHVAETARRGHVGASSSIRARALDPAKSVKCAVDIALIALMFSNPIVAILVQGSIDGAFALIEVTNGRARTGEAASSVGHSAVAATAGVIQLGAKVALSKSAYATAAGAAKTTFRVGLVGYAVYEVWDKGLVEGAKSLIPTSCKDAYASLNGP
jgi:hypothetical protein